MISVLAQERLLGFALGTTVSAAVVFENRRNIKKLMPGSNALLGDQVQVIKKNVVDKRPQWELTHYWNKAVDKTFGPVIVSLSQRGW